MSIRFVGSADVGVNHSYEHTNCQDGFLTLTFDVYGERIRIGMVFDGCSTTVCPEFGVRLMQLVIPKLLAELIYDPNNERKVLEKPWLLIRELYPKIQDAIRATAYTMGIVNECEFDDFVFNNCMFTIVGFWLSDQHLITFRAGDGIIFINSEANTYVQPQNVPFYLGHTLLSDNDPRKVREVEAVFEIKRYPRQGFIRVLVATDGLNPALNFLAKTVWTCRNELDLKSKLIMLFNQQITYDDTAVVFALLEEVA